MIYFRLVFWSFALHIFTAFSEDPMEHFGWRRNLTRKFPNTWSQYAIKWLELTLDRTGRRGFSFATYLQNLYQKSIYFVEKVTTGVHTCEYGNMRESMTIKEPIVELKIESRLCQKPVRYFWMFSLDSELRLNVTFKYIKTAEVLGNCVGRNIRIQSNDTFFLFCGFQSKFNFYPPSPDIALKAEAKVVDLSFQATFSIFSKDIIVNELPDIEKDFVPKYVDLIEIRRLILYTYELRGEKFENMNLGFQALQNVSLMYFDGPGFLSKKGIASTSKANIALSTFQCILQVLHLAAKSVQYKVSFFGKEFPVKTVTLIKFTNVIVDTSNSPHAHNVGAPSAKVYQIISPVNTTLKITVTNFTFIGRPSSRCYYGGASLFNENNGTWNEFESFCNKDIDKQSIWWWPPQITYSKYNNILFVLHWCKEYSSLNLKAEISYTFCKVVIISPCKMQVPPDRLDGRKLLYALQNLASLTYPKIVLNPSYCTILHKTSGKYETIQERDLTLYSQMLEMNSIPIVLCPMVLQMDQIKFGTHLEIYNVTGFFKATPLLQMHGTWHVSEYSHFSGQYFCTIKRQRHYEPKEEF